jgi:hypothetical protein
MYTDIDSNVGPAHVEMVDLRWVELSFIDWRWRRFVTTCLKQNAGSSFFIWQFMLGRSRRPPTLNRNFLTAGCMVLGHDAFSPKRLARCWLKP